VQAALDGLREKNLISHSARGTYALEDETLAPGFDQESKTPSADSQ
jgi:hypothetical protein